MSLRKNSQKTDSIPPKSKRRRHLVDDPVAHPPALRSRRAAGRPAGAAWKGTDAGEGGVSRCGLRLATLERRSLGRGHRVERRAPSRRMNAMALHSASSAPASTIRPLAVAATDNGRLAASGCAKPQPCSCACAPRRSEAAALTMGRFEWRGGRWGDVEGQLRRRERRIARGLRSHGSRARRPGVVIASSGGCPDGSHGVRASCNTVLIFLLMQRACAR